MAKKRARKQTVNSTPDQKKSRIDLIYLTADGVRHTVRKLSTKATTLLEIVSRFEVCSQSYGAPKSQKSQLTRFRDSHSRVLGEKSHLDVGSVASHRVYYKGEGGDFPQVWAMVNLVCPCCLWLVLAPKVLQLCTNHFVWVVCRLVWMNEACKLFLVPSRSSNTPFNPSKCYELKNVPRFFALSLSSTWIHIWVFQGVRSASWVIFSPKLNVELGFCEENDAMKKLAITMGCCNLSLGLANKARACKGACKEWSPGVTFHTFENVRKCEGMNPHTPKWAPTLGVGSPDGLSNP